MRWFGIRVAEIKQISAYSCRGMNGNSRAHISEHAFGNALDIASFTLADGRVVTVKNGWKGMPEEQGFLRDIQAAACQQFNTVLAPGSNVYHYDHIHVDLMRRKSQRTICQPAAVSGEEIAGRAGQRNPYASRENLRDGIDRRPQDAVAPAQGQRQGQRRRRVPGRIGVGRSRLPNTPCQDVAAPDSARRAAAERRQLTGRQQQIGKLPPVMGCIAKRILQPERAAQIELGVAIIGEAEAAVELDGAVSCEDKTVARLHFRHPQRDLGVLAGGEQRCCVVKVRARALESRPGCRRRCA